LNGSEHDRGLSNKTVSVRVKGRGRVMETVDEGGGNEASCEADRRLSTVLRVCCGLPRFKGCTIRKVKQVDVPVAPHIGRTGLVVLEQGKRKESFNLSNGKKEEGKGGSPTLKHLVEPPPQNIAHFAPQRHGAEALQVLHLDLFRSFFLVVFCFDDATDREQKRCGSIDAIRTPQTTGLCRIETYKGEDRKRGEGPQDRLRRSRTEVFLRERPRYEAAVDWITSFSATDLHSLDPRECSKTIFLKVWACVSVEESDPAIANDLTVVKDFGNGLCSLRSIRMRDIPCVVMGFGLTITSSRFLRSIFPKDLRFCLVGPHDHPSEHD